MRILIPLVNVGLGIYLIFGPSKVTSKSLHLGGISPVVSTPTDVPSVAHSSVQTSVEAARVMSSEITRNE